MQTRPMRGSISKNATCIISMVTSERHRCLHLPWTVRPQVSFVFSLSLKELQLPPSLVVLSCDGNRFFPSLRRVWETGEQDSVSRAKYRDTPIFEMHVVPLLSTSNLYYYLYYLLFVININRKTSRQAPIWCRPLQDTSLPEWYIPVCKHAKLCC